MSYTIEISKILYRISYSLYLGNIYRVLLELRENESHSILEPESFSLKSYTLLKMLVVLDSIGYLTTRFCPLTIY